jgi:hypothetical protein
MSFKKNNYSDILIDTEKFFYRKDNKIILNPEMISIYYEYYHIKYKLNENIKYNYNYVQVNNIQYIIIKDSLHNKKITDEYFYSIKNNTRIDISVLNLNNLYKVYKLENKYKQLYIIIYKFYLEDKLIYGIIYYKDNSIKNIVIVETILELYLLLSRLENIINLNPKYSKIINTYPSFFYIINNNLIDEYFDIN